MPLVERCTREDLELYEILKNPVLFSEFIHNFDKLPNEEPFELTDYQKEFMCDFNSYVSFCSGRAVGKTLSIDSLITWLLVFNVFPQDYIVFSVPNKVHLEPVFTGLIRAFRTNSFLKHFIKSNAGINSSDFSIDLLTGSKLMCRIAGQSGTGSNIVGLHTPLFMIDEAAFYPQKTFTEAQPIVNTWTPGFRVIISGSPIGLRENNVLYYADMIDSNYTKHRVSAYQNPRFSEEDEQRAIEQYGGKDSDDFEHNINGHHGKPVFALFDRANFEMTNNPVYRMVLNGIELRDNVAEYRQRLSTFPSLADRNKQIILGIDLGYSEPSAIVILYVDLHGILKFHGRIKLEKVSYPIQEKLIDFLDTKFDPSLIGIDKGSAGIGLIQNLQEGTEYIHKNYNKRITPVDFSSNTVIGIDSEGKEITEKTKPFSTNILQDYANNHKLVFSHTDLEMITELERMTYTKTPSGEIVYRTLTLRGGKKGEDHFTSALLCGVLAYYLNNDYIMNKPKSKKLIGFSWLR